MDRMEPVKKILILAANPIDTSPLRLDKQEIVKHINYAVGMRKDVGDEAATEFSVAFYDALGNGESYDFAFEYARVALVNKGESSIPGLKKKH